MATNDIHKIALDVRTAAMCVSRQVRYQADSMPPHLFNVLAWLESGKVSTAADLAKIERVSAPSMSRTITELVDKGLIIKETDSKDRRRQLLSLSDAGREALAESRQARNCWMSKQLAGLTDEERQVLAEGAQILLHMLETK